MRWHLALRARKTQPIVICKWYRVSAHIEPDPLSPIVGSACFKLRVAGRKLILRTPRPTERDSSSGLLRTNLPLFPGGLQLPVPFRVDLRCRPANMSFGVMLPTALFKRTLL